MGHVLWSTTGAVIFLAVISAVAECRTIVKRESEIDPEHLKEFTDQSINRDKRKVEVVTGVKNAVLGFVFHKINSFIDQKTAWIDQLDKTNIAKNEAHHIYPPGDPVLSLSGIISGAIGQKLQAAGPLLHINPASKGFAWEISTTPKGPTTTEEIAIFEPGKPVSLEIPDKLFGSSFTLVTNLSTTVGDFMINSALRTQRLLESMRPFLRKVFGAKAIVIEATTDKPIFSAPNSV